MFGRTNRNGSLEISSDHGSPTTSLTPSDHTQIPPCETNKTNQSCNGRLWCFVTLGIVQLVTGFLLAVIYFSVRALTTSLEYIETIPTYANAILIVCNGILVLFLCKRNHKIMLSTVVVVSLVCLVMSSATLVTTILNALSTLLSFTSCRYIEEKKRCNCYTDYDPNIENSTLNINSEEFVFYDTLSCSVIEKNLLDFIYTLCAMYSLEVVACIMGVILCSFILKMASNSKQTLLGNVVYLHRSDEEERHSSNITTVSVNINTPESHQQISHQIALPGQQQLTLLGIRRNDSIARNLSNDRSVPNEQCHNRDQSVHDQEQNRLNDNVEMMNHIGENRHESHHVNDCQGGQQSQRNKKRQQQLARVCLQSTSIALPEEPIHRGEEPLHRGQSSTLPAQPLHRNDNCQRDLPRQPLTRGSSSRSELPPWPISRQANSNRDRLQTNQRVQSGHQCAQNRSMVNNRQMLTLSPWSGDERTRTIQHGSGQLTMAMHLVADLTTELPPSYMLPPPYTEEENDPAPDYVSRLSDEGT